MNLGDNCHFKQGAIPAAAITDLEGNVLISNTLIEETDTIPLGGNIYVSAGDVWAVSSVKILHTRFWAASTASIILSCAVPTLDKFPPVIPEELKIQKEICIWLGYLDVVKGATKQDLIEGRLIRKFVGVIDSINATGSANGGFTIKLQARCRMSWLMDSTVSYNQTEMEGLGNGAGSISRSKLILEIAHRAIGQVDLEECVNCGKTIKLSSEFTIDLEKIKDSKVLPEANVWYETDKNSIPSYEKQPLGGYTRTSLKVESDPEFRIYTSRIAINQDQSKNFLLADQGPLEMIKALSLQEVYPTEVFSSHVDGHLYYVPRANDGYSLKDPKRFYRTYYFRYNDEGININQRMLTFREEASSSSLKTNFIVSKEGQNSDGSPYKNWSLHLRVRPAELAKDVAFPCKMQHLRDPTIKTLGQAATVAVSAARIQAKNLRSGMVIVVGDPSLTPGEIIQTIGSPLLENGGLDRAKSDKDTFIEYNERYNKLIKDYAEKASKEDADEKEIELDLFDGSKANFKRDDDTNSKRPKLICNVTSSIINSDNNIGFNPTPQTIWRIEAVLDKWNAGNKGYTTELMLLDPF
jgi:hypothetical protein